jgi:acetyl esterase/lipase
LALRRLAEIKPGNGGKMLRTFIAATLLALLAGCTMGAPRDASVRLAAESIAYGDGPRRTLDVYAPASLAADARAPVIVYVYGGGWAHGDKRGYAFAGRAFAAQGFVTVLPDYRLYPEVRFPAFVNDAAAALRWTQDHVAEYGGDPSRIVLVGHSAGAHIAMLVALDPHYLADAGVDRSAIRGVAGLAGPYGFDNFDDKLICNLFCAAPDRNVVMPIHFVSASGPPLLLLHGDRDRRVPVYSTTHMAEAARAAGERVEEKIYPGLDHPGILQALGRPERYDAPVLEDVTAFARRVTQ